MPRPVDDILLCKRYQMGKDGDTMYLRINRAETKPGMREAATKVMRDMLPKLEGVPGFRGLISFDDKEKNVGGSITFWESKGAADDSMSGVRDEVIAALRPTMAGSISTETFEVNLSWRQEIENRLREGSLAYNNRDLDAITRNATDDVELKDMASGTVYHGIDEVRKYLQAWMNGFPDSTIEVVTCAVFGDKAVVEFIGRGTHTAPFSTPMGEIPPTGRKVELSLCEVHTLRQGKSAEIHSYVDLATLMRQLGLTSGQEVATR